MIRLTDHFPWVGSLIQRARVEDLHELMVVAIIYGHSDNHRGPCIVGALLRVDKI